MDNYMLWTLSCLLLYSQDSILYHLSQVWTLHGLISFKYIKKKTPKSMIVSCCWMLLNFHCFAVVATVMWETCWMSDGRLQSCGTRRAYTCSERSFEFIRWTEPCAWSLTLIFLPFFLHYDIKVNWEQCLDFIISASSLVLSTSFLCH